MVTTRSGKTTGFIPPRQRPRSYAAHSIPTTTTTIKKKKKKPTSRRRKPAPAPTPGPDLELVLEKLKTLARANDPRALTALKNVVLSYEQFEQFAWNLLNFGAAAQYAVELDDSKTVDGEFVERIIEGYPVVM